MRALTSCHALALIGALATLACSDEPPTYPAIPEGGSGGAAGAGGGSGGSKSGSGGTGGGKSGSGGDAGSAGSAGSGGTDLFAHCNEPWSGDDPAVGEVSCDLDALTDGGTLSGDITSDMTLESGKFYILQGATRVMPGVTLTIPPCVKIIGQDSNAILAIRSSDVGDPNAACTYAGAAPTPNGNGKLIARGEPMAPIVFTSAKAPGQRLPGDWGGVLILGNARNNTASAGTRVPAEGLASPECYGWHTDEYNDENSGELSYVRIEYASRQVTADSETNGLTFGAVGSGTVVHHVMVSNSADDCFEWFGGTVNAHHLIALNCDDDAFDADHGFSGNVQFIFGRQFPVTTETDSRGFEIDSTGTDPLTTAAWSNFTMCGARDDATIRTGLVLRNGAAGTLTNGIITGFGGGGVTSVNGLATTTLTHTRVFDVPRLLGDQHAGGTEWFTGQTGNSAEEPDRFCDCWSDPPVPVAATPIQGGTTAGFPDETADYVGAFADFSPESNWMKGLWVDWASQ